MSDNIVQLNEEIIKGKSKNWFVAVWRKHSLIVGDKCPGMPETVGEVFPEAKYQRWTYCLTNLKVSSFSDIDIPHKKVYI